MSAEPSGARTSAEAACPAPRAPSTRFSPPHDAFAFVLQLCGTAPTLEDTLRAVCASSPLWSRAPYFLRFEGELAFVRTELPPDEDQARLISLWLRLLAWAAGTTVTPRALFVMRPEVAAPRMAQGCPMHVDHPWFGLALARSDLRRKNPSADTRLYALLAEYTEARLCVLGQVQTTSQLLHQALRALDDLARADAALLAAKLGLNLPALHGQLRAEGSSYRRVLEQLRMQRCLARIRGGDVEPSALSQSLGFADEKSFHRAFRRWTGLSVTDYLLRHVCLAPSAAAATGEQRSDQLAAHEVR